MTTATRSTTGSLLVWGAAALLLCMPAVAMQFTRAVTWSPFDFLVFGTMLTLAAAAYEFLSRRSGRLAYRLGAAVAVFACFFLVWVNLAVGIIGSENNPANWMYAAVLATVVGGGIVVHVRAAGMLRTMLAAAGVQVLIAGIALALGLGTEGISWPADIIGVTTIMLALWLTSAALFSRAD